MKHSNIFNIIRSQKFAFWFILFIIALPNFLMAFTEETEVITRITNAMLAPSVIWFVLTLFNKPGKAYWWLFLLVFFDAFQIVLLYLFGESPIAVDMFLNVVTTNPSEAGELLSNMNTALIVVIVLYLGGMAVAINSQRMKQVLDASFRSSQRRKALIAVGVSVVLFASNFIVNPDFRIYYDIYPVNVVNNLATAVGRYDKGLHYHDTSKNFAFNAHSTHPDSIPEVYVVIVGETARGCEFGINGYNRNTTPCLSQRSDVVSFPYVLSQSNTTHKSVPMLLSALTADNFNEIYHQKSIITAFKESGFSTAFFSNQRRNYSFIDFFGEEANHVCFIKDGKKNPSAIYDDQLTEYLRKELSNNKATKKFIVLHSYGSHFNYKERYPAEYAKFQPDNAQSAKKKNRTNLVNAYDNTIIHTDHFINDVINAVSQQHVAAAVLYTSDHGEDIFDDDRNLFLHASPIPTYYQIHVPLIVWTSKEYDESYPDAHRQLAANSKDMVSSSESVFHTVIDLSGISTPYFIPSLSLSSSSYEHRPWRYLNDLNASRPLTKMRLKEEDAEQLHEHGFKGFEDWNP